MKTRKYVFTEVQFKELSANPPLATAVFQAFQASPDMNTLEAFRFARLALAQFKLSFAPLPPDVKVNVDTGELVHGDALPEGVRVAERGRGSDNIKNTPSSN